MLLVGFHFVFSLFYQQSSRVGIMEQKGSSSSSSFFSSSSSSSSSSSFSSPRSQVLFFFFLVWFDASVSLNLKLS